MAHVVRSVTSTNLACQPAAGDERGHPAPAAAWALQNVRLEYLSRREAQSRRRARSGMGGGPMTTCLVRVTDESGALAALFKGTAPEIEASREPTI